MTPAPSAPTEAWNRAYDRLVRFLNTFALGDHLHVSRLALDLLDRAREIHRRDPAQDPVTVTMQQAQHLLSAWLAQNLQEEPHTPARITPTTGYLSLLLSRLYRVAPSAFLQPHLPDHLRKSMRQTLLATGPDLNVSSMTPRHLDYGPMLDLARQTWHRWDARAFFIALLFWAAIYAALYYWLSGGLL